LETYGEHIITQKTCERWFQRFKTGEFDVKDKARPGQPKKVEDADLQALFDEDSSQTLKQLSSALLNLPLPKSNRNGKGPEEREMCTISFLTMLDSICKKV
jgi:hypothetical protein